MVISMLQCTTNAGCPPPSEILGNILYVGPFDPEFPSVFTPPNDQPQQNFSVQVPSNFQSGNQVQLAVTLLTLIGVSSSRFFLGFAFFLWANVFFLPSGRAESIT